MLILVLMEELKSYVFFFQCSDSRQTLECHGDMGIDWTSGCRGGRERKGERVGGRERKRERERGGERERERDWSSML